MQHFAPPPTNRTPPRPTPSEAEAAAAKAEVAPFLRNLRKMLDVESDEILRWTPDGRAFEIHDMERMMERVLPKYFKHRKYTSFQRQLNYFNFKKWTKSKAVVCTFSNDHFVRDRPELAWRITRKKSVPSGTAGSATDGRSPTGGLGGRSKARSPSAVARSSSLPAYSPAWKQEDDAALRVPHAKRTAATTDFPGFAQARSFPSPTDVDVLFTDPEGSGMPPQRYYSPMPLVGPVPFLPAPSTTTMASFMTAAEPESLEWIDTFLPSLDMGTRLADDQPQPPPQQPHAYMGSMMAALMRPTPPHYMFPAANPPTVDGYMLATM